MDLITKKKESVDDEIDVLQLLHTLWLQRKVIISIAFVSASVGLGVAQLSTKYVSEAVLQLPKKIVQAEDVQVPIISAANYKPYESALLTGSNLAKFLQRNPQAPPESLALLEPLTLNPQGLREAIKPEFYTDKYLQTLGVKSEAIDPWAILGLRLSIDSANPTQGAPLFLLADYVRDSILRLDMEAAIDDGCLQNQNQEKTLRVEQLRDEFKVIQEERRAKILRSLVSRSASIQYTQQVVSVEKGSERFLLPSSQLIASEIIMSELRLGQDSRKRDQIASALKKAYYCNAASTLQKNASAAALLDVLKEQQVTVFKDKTKDGDVIEQIANELELQRDIWSKNYLRGMRFVSSPEGSEVKFRKLGHAKGLILGALLGSLLGIIFVFSRQWWQANKDEITAL